MHLNDHQIKQDIENKIIINIFRTILKINKILQVFTSFYKISFDGVEI